jgi:hypothetical protein
MLINSKIPCIIFRKEEGRRKREEGRRKKEKGRRKREEGRRKREEGRGKKKLPHSITNYQLPSSQYPIQNLISAYLIKHNIFFFIIF